MNRTNRILVATSLGLSSLLASIPSQAQDLITAKDPNVILNVAKGFGSAKLDKDDGGDPMIVGRMDGVRYGIYFYGCKNGKDCDDIQFTAAWDEDKFDPADINDWNLTKRYGRAYVDKDGDPTIDMVVNLDYGVSEANLEDSFNWWGVVLREFEKQVLKYE